MGSKVQVLRFRKHMNIGQTGAPDLPRHLAHSMESVAPHHTMNANLPVINAPSACGMGASHLREGRQGCR